MKLSCSLLIVMAACVQLARCAGASEITSTERGPITVIATVEISSIPEELSAFARAGFSKYVSVFGVHVFATPDTGDDKLLHAAGVMAQYLDNDEDGVPDNMLAVSHLVGRNAYLVMTADEREFERIDHDKWHDAGFHAGQFLHAEEIRPGFIVDGKITATEPWQYDASLEEMLHLITDHGFANAYPSVFGRERGTVISDCTDRARGGYFERVPTNGPNVGYPRGAWFHYDDRSCDHDCMISEYLYWALTTLLGTQDFGGRAEALANEWELNTPELLAARDPHVYALLTNPDYKLPTIAPDGRYRPLASDPVTVPVIVDRSTLDLWSAPYRSWNYWPDHVISARPLIEGFEQFHNTDVPTVYRLPGDDKWYMSFIAFDGKGYNSFVAESEDLVRWKNLRQAMGFGPEGEFDHGGCVIGAFLYESYDIKAPRLLKKRNGKYWTLYGAYPRQGGYELRPGYEGIASSAGGVVWKRSRDKYILSVRDSDCGQWEQSCIYQPWLVEHEGTFYDFYNAANGGVEQMGLAVSDNLFDWNRFEGNPVVRNTPGGYDEKFCSDGKVFRDGDHWAMFYFGVGRGGAHIMVAFSRDLFHWTVHPEPLYKAGGHPLGLDKTYAHKISLVYNRQNDTFYMFYCAVGNKGRGIGLITSRPIEGSYRRDPVDRQQ